MKDDSYSVDFFANGFYMKIALDRRSLGGNGVKIEKNDSLLSGTVRKKKGNHTYGTAATRGTGS